MCAGAEHLHPSLRYEGPCLTRAAEPPADQFGTLALPAHSQREPRHLGGRYRPAPGFADHWAGLERSAAGFSQRHQVAEIWESWKTNKPVRKECSRLGLWSISPVY